MLKGEHTVTGYFDDLNFVHPNGCLRSSCWNDSALQQHSGVVPLLRHLRNAPKSHCYDIGPHACMSHNFKLCASAFYELLRFFFKFKQNSVSYWMLNKHHQTLNVFNALHYWLQKRNNFLTIFLTAFSQRQFNYMIT